MKKYLWMSSAAVVISALRVKQATCIKQACTQFPNQANTLICTCIQQVPVLSEQILIIQYRLESIGILMIVLLD